MGAGHASGDGLYVEGHSWLHRLPPPCKVAAVVASVLAVVATRREAFWAFGFAGVVVTSLAWSSGVGLRRLAKRLTFELPFLGFAVLLPFVAGGDRVDVGPLSLSRDGLWGGWNIVAKATIGLGLSVVLTSTTTIPDLLSALERLRMPRPLVAVMGFMVRFGNLIADESTRMRTARASRGYEPRWIWQAGAIASTAGNLFVRSYERGERVYLAMQSRGFAGTLPNLGSGPIDARPWVLALSLPTVLAGMAVASVVTA